MKYISALAILLTSLSAFSSIRCLEVDTTGIEPLTSWQVYGEGSYKFSAPSVVKGKEIREVSLFLDQGNEHGIESLGGSFPLSFKIKGDFILGNFILSGKWSHAQIVAYYGEDLCGPELEYQLSM